MSDDVHAWIEKLGNMTATEIATLLAEEGIKGYRKVYYACPIANLVKSKTGKEVGVTSFFYTLEPNVVRTPPESVVEFIQAFDKGKYPELVEGLSYG